MFQNIGMNNANILLSFSVGPRTGKYENAIRGPSTTPSGPLVVYCHKKLGLGYNLERLGMI